MREESQSRDRCPSALEVLQLSQFAKLARQHPCQNKRVCHINTVHENPRLNSHEPQAQSGFLAFLLTTEFCFPYFSDLAST
jgi:hypothetical protein